MTKETPERHLANKRFDEILKRTPALPGVYLMKNHQDKVIYVGKAINLKNRLSSYFGGRDPRPFVRRLEKILGDVETIITRNEKEALLLENRLIKSHQPRFNVRLRDDKYYLSLRLDTSAKWPRVEVVRRPKSDGARYFGPYHSAASLRKSLRTLNRHFGLRTCTDHVLRNRSRPCLQYQIKRCPAPCVLDVEEKKYAQSVKEAVLFLKGERQELLESLGHKMKEASAQMEYEIAARCRDQIRDITRSLEAQHVEQVLSIDEDVVGLCREGDLIALEILNVRRGALCDARRFVLTDEVHSTESLLESFLVQYYTAGKFIPHRLILPVSVTYRAALEELLSELSGRKVKIIVPQRGRKRSLVETANTNAAQAIKEVVGEEAQRRRALLALQKRLHLSAPPSRIECFDISNLGDRDIVAAMTVFIDGRPAPSAYRSYGLKEIQGQNDFAALEEVLQRRAKRILKGDEPWPDLWVIDGGKGQLSSAMKVIEMLGIHEIPVVSLAKARSDKKTEERLFLPNVKDPLILNPRTAEHHLLVHLRDETHRRAVDFHRKRRKKRTLASALRGIKGVGPAIERRLMRRFGSLKKIHKTPVEELIEIPGITRPLALRISQTLEK
jgi:excinuclease ABC subunit C